MGLNFRKKETNDRNSFIISVISLIFSIVLCIVTVILYLKQYKQIQKQNLPNLRIISVISDKSDSTSSINDGTYCRIFSGESEINLSLNGQMAVFDAKDEKIEEGFIDEIQSHIGKNDTYFTYFGLQPYLIINHATSKENFIIDHSNVKITLHNYGATINSMAIDSLTVYYKPNMNIEPFTFYGDINNKITLSPDENNEFVLFLDEVTTNLNNSLCKTSPSQYQGLPKSCNLLRTHMVENKLQYDKLEIIVHCWDLYNNETISKITFEYNGNFFVSSTTVSEINFWKKVFN